MEERIHYRACNLCEAICGLEIKVKGKEIISINGDKNDPFSRGHICPKAVGLKDIYEDKNRLKHPVRRTDTGWEQISWDEAFTEVVTNIKRIQAQHGNNAVGIYSGNPAVHNSGTLLSLPGFGKALNTKSRFSATSSDQLPHHVIAGLLYGHPLLLPIPDIDHTDFMVIMGGNPMASNGSIMTVPDFANRLKAIQKRGGKVTVIDPRFTETSAKADEHIFVKPGTDAFLLLAMANLIFSTNRVKLGHLSEMVEGLDQVAEWVQNYTPESVSEITGITAEKIIELTNQFLAAEKPVLYGRMGLSVQEFGGICQWLLNVINIITGRLDSPGGYMFPKPAMDLLLTKKAGEKYFDRWQSRVRGLPEYDGEIPNVTMAEEILTPGEGQIKAMITVCGNPVLSTSNGVQLDTALESLEFMMAVDIYINETTRHANIILPPATGLEVYHYDVVFHHLAVRNTAKYSEPLFEKEEGAKYDWEIFEELKMRMQDPNFDKNAQNLKNPEERIAMGLKYGGSGISLEDLIANPHGIDLGPLTSIFPTKLLSSGKKIDLAIPAIKTDLERLSKVFDNRDSLKSPFTLIGRRHLRSNNSWMHNSERLVKGRDRCTLIINTLDAKNLMLDANSQVRVSSRVGSVELAIEISDDIMQGVVSMPHGYGHGRKGVQLDIAQKHAGVSINDLTDEMMVDGMTGNSAFSGVPVEICLA
jgi:anaerobic selenocysteine-containing dehydrogenase